MRPGRIPLGVRVMTPQKTTKARALKAFALTRFAEPPKPETPLSILSLPTRLWGETLGMRFGDLTQSPLGETGHG